MNIINGIAVQVFICNCMHSLNQCGVVHSVSLKERSGGEEIPLVLKTCAAYLEQRGVLIALDLIHLQNSIVKFSAFTP